MDFAYFFVLPFIIYFFCVAFGPEKKKGNTRPTYKQTSEEERLVKDYIARLELDIKRGEQLSAEISEQSKKNRKAIAEMKAAQKREKMAKRRNRAQKKHLVS